MLRLLATLFITVHALAHQLMEARDEKRLLTQRRVRGVIDLNQRANDKLALFWLDQAQAKDNLDKEHVMNNIIWLVGAVVIVLFILAYFGLR